MKVSEKDLQALETLVPNTTVAETESLKNSGLSVVTYGVRPGDTIEFFDSYEQEGTVLSRSFAGGKEFLVACKRNGELSLFSISDLRRRNADMTGVGEFRKLMLTTCEHDAERLAKITGMTIKAGDMLAYQTPKAFVPLVMLGHVVKHRVELGVGQDLGVGLGPVIIPGNDVGNGLGGSAKVRCNFFQTILHKTHL